MDIVFQEPLGLDFLGLVFHYIQPLGTLRSPDRGAFFILFPRELNLARIRTIKPAFWDDEKLSKLSFLARLTYIGMWTFSDDYGVVKGNSFWLKNSIFPYNDFQMPEFENSLKELVDLKRIFQFEHESEVFFYMPYFVNHQKIDKPNIVTKNPKPPKDFRR